MNLLINFRDITIESVEKGNADQDVERPVCAFSFYDDDGNKVKALLKGAVAKLAWEHYLSNQNTMAQFTELEDGTVIEKIVTVDFDAHVREERTSEVVVDNIEDIIFNFKYRIME